MKYHKSLCDNKVVTELFGRQHKYFFSAIVMKALIIDHFVATLRSLPAANRDSALTVNFSEGTGISDVDKTFVEVLCFTNTPPRIESLTGQRWL